MPIIVEYRDNGIGAVFRGAGVVTGDDLLQANMELFSSIEKTKKYKYGLADWTDVTEYRTSASEFEKAALQNKIASEYLPDLIVAVVADKDLDFGFSRMWASFIEANNLKWVVKLFRQKESAESWLKEEMMARYSLDISFS
jgi:hypothetical protein